MEPVSVITLIDRFKKEKYEILVSTKEWFQTVKKEYIVLDERILDYDIFYESLDDSPSEVILENVEKVLGTHVSRDKIKESLFMIDSKRIVLYYLRWSWFREYVSPFLGDLKKAVSLPPLNYCFGYDPVVRNPIIKDKKDFIEWFFSNYYVGYPNKYCDVNKFISCASSYYDFDSLKKWNVSINETSLCELGAIHEAAKSGAIWFVERPSQEFLDSLSDALDSLVFPKELKEKLRQFFSV